MIYKTAFMFKTIVVLGFVQALFGVLIFINRKSNHLSFKLLIIWLAIIAVFQGALLLPFEVVDYFKPGIFPLLFTFGPLLYLYLASLVKENFKLKRKYLFHLLPLILVSIHRSLTEAVSITSTMVLSENPAFVFNTFYNVILVVSLFVYWIFSLQLILNHRKNIPLYFSYYSQKNTLTWLIFLVLIFMILIITDLFLSSLSRIFEIELSRFFSLPVNLTIFTFIMVFFGINQSVIYGFKKEGNGAYNNAEQSEKYSRSSLTRHTINNINEKVINYLKSKKPYLNAEFSFQMMVNDLGISRQTLSQVINTSQKQNFYKLINGFRVDEVKEMMKNPAFEKYTLLGIAFECGFNSKTSFNRIFKEITGKTPTEFKNSNTIDRM